MATNNAVNNSLTGQTGSGLFVGSTSPVLTNPYIPAIVDVNTNTILLFSSVASAVNYLTINNSATGSAAALSSSGADSNIGIDINTKGSGSVKISTEAVNIPLHIHNGTSSQHETNLFFENTSGSRTVNFPDRDFTIATAPDNDNITSFSGITGVIKAPTFIDDSGNAHVLGFTGTPGAVNYFNMDNTYSGGHVRLNSAGESINIGIIIEAKGSDPIEFKSEASSNQYIFYSGDEFSHVTNFSFPSTTQIRTVTFQDASGTVAYSGINTDITSLTGLTGVLQAPTAINDVNGNSVLNFGSVASAVNSIEIINSVTGNSPEILATGTDADVSLKLSATGSGSILFTTLSSSEVIKFVTGTSYQHTTNLSFPNTSASRTITFQDASGTLAFSGANTDITSLSGITGVIQGPTQINDANSNEMLVFNPVGSAVNYLSVSNSSVGQSPYITSAGGDAIVNLSLRTKGIGEFIFESASTIAPIQIKTGTAYQKTTYFNFANTAGTNTVNFQDSTGTVAFTSQLPSSGSPLSPATGGTGINNGVNTLTVSANSTINQNVSTTAAPTFLSVNVGNLISSPASSQASSLALGAVYQNTFGYDIVLTVYISVASSVTASISSGIGPLNPPSQQTIISGLTISAITIIPVTLYIPTNYYALITTAGTISATISGQQAMPV